MGLFERVRDRLDGDVAACLVTVIESDRPDRPVGTACLVLPDGSAEDASGPVGIEEALRDAAVEALRSGRSGTVALAPGLRVFLDVIRPDPHLVVCGAGHIAGPLSRIAREAGFRVTVVDDRPDFADPARFPGCAVVAEDFAAALRGLPIRDGTYVVVITRGHAHDVDCVEAVAGRGASYVGLIGSRRRVRVVADALAANGVPSGAIADLFTPIGMPIGAASAAEIALSIAAELVAVRRLGPDGARTLRGQRWSLP